MFHSSGINVGMPGCFTVNLVKLRTTFPRIPFPLPSDWNCSEEELEWDLRNGTKAESLLSEEFQGQIWLMKRQRNAWQVPTRFSFL